RPLLAKHCLDCHGEKKQQADLRLDSRAAMLQGNETGPAIVPGRPDESRLVQVNHYDEFDVQIPPPGKLQEEAIAALTEWIRLGAPWPASSPVPSPAEEGIDFAAARAEHWAYQPVTRPSVPDVSTSEPGRVAPDRADTARLWCRTPIDRFVLSKLQSHGLTPAPRVDRRTLIRRATFDLLGLPPTWDEVQDFVTDPAPDEAAFARVVDRLLASPHYGERWGRHWLDVARYADSKGYVFAAETRYPFSYTYRDYVVRALNADLPYDRFLLEQIAADQLERADDRSLAALGFLTVGRRFRNSEPDIIDDRIDVVTRGLMGLTVSCARCHDHKYDPIPTADYYSLFGVFDSCYEPDDLPLIAEPEATAEYAAFKTELDKRQTAVDE
ncbi:MAG: DUF1549 domain-containing protein, partial [Planctomycetaceae bacterium]